VTRLFTVGHGARSIDQLTAILAPAGVGRLIDIRRYPGSRRHPQFGRSELATELPGRDIEYEWRGEELGGRRRPAEPTRHPEWRDAGFRGFADYMDSEEFGAALRRLLEDADGSPPLVIMCAETLWWRCHRRLIADAVVGAGVDVVHLLGPDQQQAHPAGLV
jgi:uncharacterized protein (DUF488 family)